MEDKDKLEILRKLLLSEEQEFADSISKKVDELNKIVHEKNKLSPKVDPIIDDKLKTFVEEIPQKLGPTITQALKEEIKNSQDAVVEALFPIIGKMIKKYIAHEMKMLSENIDKKTRQAFSIKNWFRKKKVQSKGVSLGDQAIADMSAPELKQMLVIEKDSGLLISDYSPSKENPIDKDMIAGMLTAIKSFVEDAFQGGNQNLETIEYELYTIHVQNFHSYYIAVVISGTYNLMFKEKLENKLLDFAQHYISIKDLEDNKIFTQKLKKHFTNEVV